MFDVWHNALTCILLQITQCPPVTDVAAGGFHSLVIMKGGEIYAWGRGGEGQLGGESRLSVAVPGKMVARLNDDSEEEGLYGQKAVDIAAGYWHSMIVCKSGELVFLWSVREGCILDTCLAG